MGNNDVPPSIEKLRKIIEENKTKNRQAAIGVTAIITFFFGPMIVSIFNDIFVLGRYEFDRILPGIGVTILILIILFAGLHGLNQKKKLLPAIEALITRYRFTTIDDNEMCADYQPELPILKGKFNNRKIMIWPARDPERKQNKQSSPATIFAAPVTPEWPAFKLKKNSGSSAIFGKIWGGIDYKEKYIIQFTGKTTQSKEEQLARVTAVLNDSVLYEFDNIPGKNRIESESGLFALIHYGFIYNEEEYMPFMNMISKVR